MVKVSELKSNEQILALNNEQNRHRWLIEDSTTNGNRINYSYAYRRLSTPQQRNLMPNLMMQQNIPDFQGYDPAIPLNYKKYLALINRDSRSLYQKHFGLVNRLDSPWLTKAGVNTVIGDIRNHHPLMPQILQSEQSIQIPVVDQTQFIGIRIDYAIENAASLKPGQKLFMLSLISPNEKGKNISFKWDINTSKTIEDYQGKTVGLSTTIKFSELKTNERWYRIRAKIHGDPGNQFSVRYFELKNLTQNRIQFLKFGLARSEEFMNNWEKVYEQNKLPIYSTKQKTSTNWNQAFATTTPQAIIFNLEELYWQSIRQLNPLKADIVFDPENILKTRQIINGATTLSIDPEQPIRKANRFSFKAEVQNSPAFITVVEAKSKGWIAKINGVKTQIFEANEMFMGIIVPPGSHKIEFIYRPTEFYLALLISLLTITATIIYYNRTRNND